ncbi:hypothetical protein H0R92_06640 [Treponema sp. OMZ 840]|uniref:lipoprotein 17-related variable surface protein n=1 Tax=Treponema sp. OMZ 840 TaxID=244313 RepID=UPI003D8A632B
MTKKKTNKYTAALGVLIFIILAAGCPNSGAPKGGANQQKPQKPNQGQIQPGDLLKEDIMSAFALTKGNITASDAAKKIRDTPPFAGSGLTFTEKTLTAYDDKAGTFTVKVKGTKRGKSFEKELAFTGFTHPYAGTTLGSLYTPGNVFVFDKAIEENIPLERFIDDANAARGEGFVSFSYSLNAGSKTVVSGKHSAYELTARLTKVHGDKVKIMADYKTVYKKLSGGNESVEYGTVSTKTAKESESYFTQDDVLKYVFGKTNDNFVKVDTNKFASSYYAMSKFSNSSAVQFDTAQIQKYVDLYKTPGKYLQINIEAGINNPKNGGIEANDFTGELTVDYCIATADQLTAQSGILHSKKITKSGLQKIDSAEDALRNHFTFTVVLSPRTKETKEAWTAKSLSQNTRLFYVDENAHNPVGVLTNPLPMSPSTQPSVINPFYLTLNADGDIGATLGSGNYGLSKDTNNRDIYIKSISLDKTAGKNELEVSMELCGGKIVGMTTTPR